MSLKAKNKKNGFTLIELVIVLAVLAIIALIAIPNFNKVRTDSQKKADNQTCEVIERVTTMAIANQDLEIADGKTGKIVIEGTTNGGVLKSSTDVTWTLGALPTDATATTEVPANNIGKYNYKIALKEVDKVQEKNKNVYEVTINDKDEVTKVETKKVS